ncbi:hypothetical protein [Vibrio aestuarianus]|uniref:Uncharacterized protein n=1 Tax=Vibrio aestuarianus TaxID=28171 RepID=A0ABD7YQX5_9VIBR|nr:hypothetical protein [Vibrio aestuarianus]WGK86818.1 hypothetical protein PYE67_17885 [Vibrio aestuarianus]CAH8234590.1 hypothetical protein VAEU17_4360122 [Vibrio aestuarianus]CAH8242783.1 hypothetical protein VAEKB19_80002 [Vibrio aestuarianus]
MWTMTEQGSIDLEGDAAFEQFHILADSLCLKNSSVMFLSEFGTDPIWHYIKTMPFFPL